MVRTTIWNRAYYGALTLVLLAIPAPSQACDLSWLWPWNWGKKRETVVMYAPVYYADPCATCYTPSCAEVPACTTCAPAAVTYRPVSVHTYRPLLVPYTTYRVASPISYSVSYPAVVYYPTTVYAGTCCPSGCDPCYGATSAYTVPSSSCPTGDCGAATTVPSISAEPAPALPPNTQAGPPATYGDTSNGQAYTQSPGAQPPSIYQQGPQSPASSTEQQRLRPTPGPDTEPTSLPLPRGGQSVPHTAARPVLPASYARPIEGPVFASGPSDELDCTGWRPARP